MFHHHRPLCGRWFTVVALSSFAGFAVGRVFAYLELHQIRRVHTRITRRAEPALGITDRPTQRREGNVAERIRAKEFADFFRSVGRGDQFFPRGRVHAIVTGRNCRWATDAHVDFFCADFANHADDFAAGGAADDGIIDEYHALAFDQAADGIELELHAEITDGLRRLDKGAANVVVADQAHAERNPGFERVAYGGRDAGIRHGDDDVRIHRMLARKEASEHLAAFVYGAAENDAVRAGGTDVLQDTLLERLFGCEPDGLDARFGNAHHLARFDLADILRVEQVERAGLGSDQPGNEAAGRGYFSQHQGAKTARVADGVEFVLGEYEQGIRAFDLIEGIAHRTGKISRFRAADARDDAFGVALGLDNRSAMLELAPSLETMPADSWPRCCSA